MLKVVGFNWQTAPMELLESLHVKSDEIADLLYRIRQATFMPYLPEVEDIPSLDNLVVVSTCNRLELFTTDEITLSELTEIFISNLESFKKTKINDGNILYALEGEKAISHLFKMTSGLESAITGEPQIFNQVKRSYEISLAEGYVSSALNKIFQKAFSVAKNVRHNTSIHARAISLQNLTAKIISRYFGGNTGIMLTIFGAGELGSKFYESLNKKGFENLNLISREKIVSKGVPSKSNSDSLNRIINKSDVLITATYSEGFLINPFDLIGNRPQTKLIFDLSMPRLVDPQIVNIPGIELFTLKNLMDLSSINLGKRREDVDNALGIVNSELDSFLRYLELWNSKKSLLRNVAIR